jgi:hypothetical protein
MYLSEPPSSPAADAMYAADRAAMGYVMTGSHLWAHGAQLHDGLFDLMGQVATTAGLTLRQRGILVTACAATLGDSYCSMAWGHKLVGVADADLAAGVLRGMDQGLDERERVLAAWARRLAGDGRCTGGARKCPRHRGRSGRRRRRQGPCGMSAGRAGWYASPGLLLSAGHPLSAPASSAKTTMLSL